MTTVAVLTPDGVEVRHYTMFRVAADWAARMRASGALVSINGRFS